MQNQTQKPYFNQITMIESQYESKRKNISNPTSSLLQTQTRSPLRERESTILSHVDTNSMNTPSRVNNGKASLSPIRSRRNDCSMASTRSTAISRRKNVENVCENHGNKSAKYMIEKDGECFYFCERCAIQLISNGFKLTKMEVEEKNENSQRMKEINDFLKKLDNLDANMNKRKNNVRQIVEQSQKELDGELEKIEQFYSQFYDIIDEHKKRVVGEIKAEYQKSAKTTKDSFQEIEKSISDSNNIKEDILSSMNSVIIEVSEEDFRSVMTHYYTCLNELSEVCTNKEDESIKVRTLSFKNEENVCQAFVEGLVIEWDDEEGEQDEEEDEREREEAPESDRENPIECLETEERNRGKIKEIGGLFCSFDE